MKDLVKVLGIGLLVLSGVAVYLSIDPPPRKTADTITRSWGNGSFDPPSRPIPKELPKAPFDLPKPASLPAIHDGDDYSKIDVNSLAAIAREAAEEDKDFYLALHAQYWAVEKGDDGFYNLACYYSQNKKIEEGIYWLQKAAQEEGVDPYHTLRDPDMNNLRLDSRYESLFNFLLDCRLYWYNQTKNESFLYLPDGHDKNKSTPVLLLFHGYGDRPKLFLGDILTQELANAISIPILSISGPKLLGPKSFRWEEGPLDEARIDIAMKEIRDRVTIDPDKVIALGFSQGAQVSIEVSARNPKRYAGAIAISPGGEFRLKQITPIPSLHNQSYFITVGGREAEGNIELAEENRDWLKKTRADVDYQVLTGHGHQLPVKFAELLPKWVEAILKHRQPK
jgi:predicted esterase